MPFTAESRKDAILNCSTDVTRGTPVPAGSSRFRQQRGALYASWIRRRKSLVHRCDRCGSPCAMGPWPWSTPRMPCPCPYPAGVLLGISGAIYVKECQGHDHARDTHVRGLLWCKRAGHVQAAGKRTSAWTTARLRELGGPMRPMSHPLTRLPKIIDSHGRALVKVW